MIAQYRPDIARAVEETVVNLKALEQTLEVLRNDLAWLAQTVGHPQAAQLVLTPSRTIGGIPGVNPFIGSQIGNPYLTPFGAFGPQTGINAIAPPYGAWGPQTIGQPYGVSPFVGQPHMTNPFVGVPNGTLPYAQLIR